MNSLLFRIPNRFSGAVAALSLALSVAACGGGGVSANLSPVVDSVALTILPDTAVLYSGMPTTFILSGGTGAYIVASSNQAIVPIAGGVTGRSLTLVPNPVVADTTVTLTVRDTGSAAPVTATLTVKPGTVNNDITITRTSTVTGCSGVALCSGGDAEVTVRLSQGGIPLAARGVRFSAVSGDFRFIITPAGTTPERLDIEAVTVTDQTGVARARIRILPAADNQTAQMQVTDLGSGAFQRTSFVIAQVTLADASFYTVPASLDLVGPRPGVCATASSNVYVYGGTPPYTIGTTSPFFSVDPPPVVSASGGLFTVRSVGGTCPSDGVSATVLVTDALGRVRQMAVTNKPTTDILPALVVTPETVSLESCGARATVEVAGGTGIYQFATGSGAIVGSVFGSTVTIYRKPDSVAPPPAAVGDVFVPVSAGISDSVTTRTVTVRLSLAGAGYCP